MLALIDLNILVIHNFLNDSIYDCNQIKLSTVVTSLYSVVYT